MGGVSKYLHIDMIQEVCKGRERRVRQVASEHARIDAMVGPDEPIDSQKTQIEYIRMGVCDGNEYFGIHVSDIRTKI